MTPSGPRMSRIDMIALVPPPPILPGVEKPRQAEKRQRPACEGQPLRGSGVIYFTTWEEEGSRTSRGQALVVRRGLEQPRESWSRAVLQALGHDQRV